MRLWESVKIVYRKSYIDTRLTKNEKRSTVNGQPSTVNRQPSSEIIKYFQLRRLDIETFPVIGTKPVHFNAPTVLSCTVSLIVKPVILRVFSMELLHEVVPVGFSHDAGCCNGCINPVSTDHALMRNLFILIEHMPVDQQKFRLDF